MSSDATMTCGVCGHRVPVASARGRGYANCTCGAILQCPRRPNGTGVAFRVVLTIVCLAVLASAAVGLAHYMH